METVVSSIPYTKEELSAYLEHLVSSYDSLAGTMIESAVDPALISITKRSSRLSAALLTIIQDEGIVLKY